MEGIVRSTSMCEAQDTALYGPILVGLCWRIKLHPRVAALRIFSQYAMASMRWRYGVHALEHAHAISPQLVGKRFAPPCTSAIV